MIIIINSFFLKLVLRFLYQVIQKPQDFYYEGYKIHGSTLTVQLFNFCEIFFRFILLLLYVEIILCSFCKQIHKSNVNL
jgi:hypothetical protein